MNSTTLKARRFFLHLNHKQKCFGESSSFFQSWRQDLSLLRRVTKTRNSRNATLNSSNSEKSSKWMIRLRALADRVAAVRNSKDIAKAFPRVIIGLVLLTIVAPYADVFYTRLDFNDRVSADVWYYESYHWLFLCLGPYLKAVFQAIALYLIFNARANMIFAPVAAYCLMYDAGKILWLLQVSNHEEYKSLPTGLYMVYGFMAGLFIILMLDRLTFWLHHRMNAIKARLQGLRNIADKADPQIIVNGFVRTMDDDINVQQFKY